MLAGFKSRTAISPRIIAGSNTTRNARFFSAAELAGMFSNRWNHQIRRARGRKGIGILLGILFWVTTPVVSYAAELEEVSCSLPGVSHPARCGTFEVAENRAHPEGRRIKVAFAVIPASNGAHHADPIVPLMGGPGESTISEAADLIKQFNLILDAHDLLLVDQRGTGQSAALRCSLFAAADPGRSLRDLFPIEPMADCAQRLSESADLAQYGYTNAADDLQALARKLGYRTLNLYSASYGTRAAQVFLRRYPRSVRTVYFGSIVPIDIAIPSPFAKSAADVLEKTLLACESSVPCHQTFPRLRDEFHAIMQRLARGDVDVNVPGTDQNVRLSQGRVAEWMRSRMYRPYTAVRLPLEVHKAFGGDWREIVDGVLRQAQGADEELSFGLFFSNTCSADVPFLTKQDLIRQDGDDFLGPWRVLQQRAACDHWPVPAVSATYRVPVRSNVPSLFVSGDADPATPLWFTRHAEVGFQNRLEILMPNRGHTEWDPCVAEAYRDFVQTASTKPRKAPDCSGLARPEFVLKD